MENSFKAVLVYPEATFALIGALAVLTFFYWVLGIDK